MDIEELAFKLVVLNEQLDRVRRFKGRVLDEFEREKDYVSSWVGNDSEDFGSDYVELFEAKIEGYNEIESDLVNQIEDIEFERSELIRKSNTR